MGGPTAVQTSVGVLYTTRCTVRPTVNYQFSGGAERVETAGCRPDPGALRAGVRTSYNVTVTVTCYVLLVQLRYCCPGGCTAMCVYIYTYMHNMNACIECIDRQHNVRVEKLRC